MDYFWTQYGLALYDVAAVTKSTGGLWIAGGVIRNNIEKVRNQPEIIDEHIEKLLMEGIDRAGTQNHLISKMPVYAITDGYLGIKGAMAAAAIPKYNKQLKFYK
ncbi:hypothetical protein HN451_05455, partial [archaeon]|nr:hypothetical protein [archaeon]